MTESHFTLKINYVLLKENAIRKLSLFYFPRIAPLTAIKHKKKNDYNIYIRTHYGNENMCNNCA